MRGRWACGGSPPVWFCLWGCPQRPAAFSLKARSGAGANGDGAGVLGGASKSKRVNDAHGIVNDVMEQGAVPSVFESNLERMSELSKIVELVKDDPIFYAPQPLPLATICH